MGKHKRDGSHGLGSSRCLRSLRQSFSADSRKRCSGTGSLFPIRLRSLSLVLLVMLFLAGTILDAVAGDTPSVGMSMFSTPQDCWAERPAPQDPNFLGQGAYGQVFKLGDDKCIKIFKDSSTSLTCEMVKLQATARCGGPPVYGLSDYNGRPGILMARVPIHEAIAPFPVAFMKINDMGPCAQQAVADSLAQFAHQGLIPNDFQGYLFREGNRFKFVPMDCFCTEVKQSSPSAATAAANNMLEAFFPEGPRIQPKPPKPSRSPLLATRPIGVSFAGGAAVGAGVQVIVDTGLVEREDLILPMLALNGGISYAAQGRPGLVGAGLGVVGGVAGSAAASALGANTNQAELAGAYGSFAAGFATCNPAAGVGNGAAIVGSYTGEGLYLLGSNSIKYGPGRFLWAVGQEFWYGGFLP